MCVCVRARAHMYVGAFMYASPCMCGVCVHACVTQPSRQRFLLPVYISVSGVALCCFRLSKGLIRFVCVGTQATDADDQILDRIRTDAGA